MWFPTNWAPLANCVLPQSTRCCGVLLSEAAIFWSLIERVLSVLELSALSYILVFLHYSLCIIQVKDKLPIQGQDVVDLPTSIFILLKKYLANFLKMWVFCTIPPWSNSSFLRRNSTLGKSPKSFRSYYDDSEEPTGASYSVHF